MKTFFKMAWMHLCIFAGLASFSTQSIASDFNIPFINAADLGNMYAGWAAEAKDASTDFTNPAGLTELHHQQLVATMVGVMGSTKFTGTTTTPLFPTPPETGTASSKLRGLLPSLYYAAPLSEKIVFGFGETVPFALGTNYAKDSIVRYAATRSQIAVIDVGPSLGYKINDAFSVGFGVDIQRLTFTLNHMYGPPLSFPDSEVQNTYAGWGYGWHGGILYKVLPTTRLGLSYNSMTMFHTSGPSTLFGSPNASFRITDQKANAALPARAQLSAYHDINPQWAVMGTLFYTNWSTLNQLTLRNVLLPNGSAMPITIPFEYHNTFDYSVGVNYKKDEKWLFRTGVQFMNTPSNNRDRSVVDPVGSGVIVGIGAHYQQNKTLEYDIGYAHGFLQNTDMNYATPLSTATGHSSQNTNFLGVQLNWNIT